MVSYVTPNLIQQGLGSLAQIKIPGVPWFTIIDQEKVIAIGNVLATTRNPKKPLDISKFAYERTGNNDPLGILLYIPLVPFEIVVNRDEKSLVKPVSEDSEDYYRAPSIISIQIQQSLSEVLKKKYESFALEYDQAVSFLK